MAEQNGWTHLRNITTVISLVNGLAVFIEKTVVDSSGVTSALQEGDVRLRLWATAGLLAAAGVLTLVQLFVSTKDAAKDLQLNAGRQRLITLNFGLGQLAVAAILAILLLALR